MWTLRFSFHGWKIYELTQILIFAFPSFTYHGSVIISCLSGFPNEKLYYCNGLSYLQTSHCATHSGLWIHWQTSRSQSPRRQSDAWEEPVLLGEIHVSLPPSSAGVQESLFHWDIFSLFSHVPCGQQGPGLDSACVSVIFLLSGAKESSCFENVSLGGWKCWESQMWSLGRVMQPDVFYYSSEQHRVRCLWWFFSLILMPG